MLRLVQRLSQGAVGMLEVLCRCLWRVSRRVQASLSFLKKSFEYLVYNPEASQDKDQPRQARAQRLLPRWPIAKVFHVQIRIAGKTSGAEKNFLKNVSKLLSRQRVSLRVKEFTETSKDPLLVFCPIFSSMANNIEIALKGLRAGQKAVLVLMHYVQRDNTGTYVDAMQQVKRADVILTVHTRYTLQEGFYPCAMNEVAVADVASALKDLA